MDKEKIRTIREVRNLHENELLQYPNVVGIGTGLKKMKGIASDEMCIVISVKKKYAIQELQASEILPKSLKVNVKGKSVEIPIDVVETGEVFLQAGHPIYSGKVRPIRPGYSIGWNNGTTITAGTGGIFIVKGGKAYLLTNSHVAITSGNPMNILQPGGLDGGTSSDAIGSPAYWNNLGSGSNYMDGAIIPINSSVKLDPDYPELPTIKGHYESLGNQWHFQKVGRTTGLTEGRIDELDFKITAGGITYEHQVKMYSWNKPISLGGDSGSVWITDDNYAGVHHIGGNGTDMAFGTPIAYVLKTFEAKIMSGSKEEYQIQKGDGWIVEDEIMEKIISESKKHLMSSDQIKSI